MAWKIYYQIYKYRQNIKIRPLNKIGQIHAAYLAKNFGNNKLVKIKILNQGFNNGIENGFCEFMPNGLRVLNL